MYCCPHRSYNVRTRRNLEDNSSTHTESIEFAWVCTIDVGFGYSDRFVQSLHNREIEDPIKDGYSVTPQENIQRIPSLDPVKGS